MKHTKMAKRLYYYRTDGVLVLLIKYGWNEIVECNIYSPKIIKLKRVLFSVGLREINLDCKVCFPIEKKNPYRILEAKNDTN